MNQIRGVAGFYYDKPMLIYQNENAEPEKLGVNILSELRTYNLGESLSFIRKSVLGDLFSADEADPASERLKLRFMQHFPLELVRRNAKTMYDLFEPLQGTLKPYIDGLVDYYPDGSDFVGDSHFCKWGYVLNVDKEQFEILRGDQTDEVKEEESPYYPKLPIAKRKFNCEDTAYFICKVVKTYNAFDLPANEQFLHDLEEFR